MRFHKITPCPDCGGRIGFSWQNMILPATRLQFRQLVFHCKQCEHTWLLLYDKPPFDKGAALQASVKRWNRQRNNAKTYLSPQISQRFMNVWRFELERFTQIICHTKEHNNE